MYGCDNRSERELPLEPYPDVRKDRDERRQHRDGSCEGELRGYCRTDHLDTSVFVLIGERSENVGSNLLLCLFLTLRLDTDKNVAFCAELLNLHVA